MEKNVVICENSLLLLKHFFLSWVLHFWGSRIKPVEPQWACRLRDPVAFCLWWQQVSLCWAGVLGGRGVDMGWEDSEATSSCSTGSSALVEHNVSGRLCREYRQRPRPIQGYLGWWWAHLQSESRSTCTGPNPDSFQPNQFMLYLLRTSSAS